MVCSHGPTNGSARSCQAQVVCTWATLLAGLPRCPETQLSLAPLALDSRPPVRSFARIGLRLRLRASKVAFSARISKSIYIYTFGNCQNFQKYIYILLISKSIYIYFWKLPYTFGNSGRKRIYTFGNSGRKRNFLYTSFTGRD